MSDTVILTIVYCSTFVASLLVLGGTVTAIEWAKR
jgi:hypothetical protein